MSNDIPLGVPGATDPTSMKTIINKQLKAIEEDRQTFEAERQAASDQMAAARDSLLQQHDQPKHDDVTLAVIEILENNPLLREPALVWLRAMRKDVMEAIEEKLKPYRLSED